MTPYSLRLYDDAIGVMPYITQLGASFADPAIQRWGLYVINV
jgi:hypothetical protein